MNLRSRRLRIDHTPFRSLCNFRFGFEKDTVSKRRRRSLSRSPATRACPSDVDPGRDVHLRIRLRIIPFGEQLEGIAQICACTDPEPVVFSEPVTSPETAIVPSSGRICASLDPMHGVAVCARRQARRTGRQGLARCRWKLRGRWLGPEPRPERSTCNCRLPIR
jgi:hypothetical protein